MQIANDIRTIDEVMLEEQLPRVMAELAETRECMIAEDKYQLSDICEDAALWDIEMLILSATLEDSLSKVVQHSNLFQCKVEAWAMEKLTARDVVAFYLEQ